MNVVVPIVALAALAGSSQLLALQPNQAFPDPGTELVKTYENLDPKVPFDEAIASWNVDNAENAEIKVDVRAHVDGHITKWYRLGDWSLDDSKAPRVSVAHQRDEDGTVDTDTLHLYKPAQSVDLQVTLRTLGVGEKPNLRFLSVTFSSGKAEENDVPTRSDAWGKTIDVPQRAQNNYPNGGVLCSATSCSMLLWHWSNLLHKPEYNKDVPEVEAHVWDKVFHGAGNWPFNTAYMGSFPGLRSYVARLNSIADLEKWVAAGLPVACSVSFDMLRGKPLSPQEAGHLVVLVGFTDDGDPVINDPAFKDQVRRVYKRSDFEKAWVYSHRTVYVVHPEDVKAPAGSNGAWFEG